MTARAALPSWARRAVVAGGSPQALGLAVALARAGCRVVLVEEDAHDMTRARDALARARALDGITLTTDAGQGSGATLAIEASGMASHRATLLQALEQVVAPEALLASAGPDVDPAAWASGLRDPSRFLAFDTAAPPPALTLVEIVTHAGTDRATLGRMANLVRALGVRALTPPRFIGAALVARLEDTVEGLIFDGAVPWELDDALEAFGFDPGPCAAQDRRGLDIAFARHRAEDAAAARRRPLPVLDRMVPEGRLGRKGSVGWYRYPGGEGRVIDPLVEDLAREEAHFAGVTPRFFTPDDIRDRVLMALVDEAATLVDEVGDPGAVDLVSIHAAGFPAAQGGVWSWGQAYGVRRVLSRMQALAATEGAHWAPSAALIRNANPGGSP